MTELDTTPIPEELQAELAKMFPLTTEPTTLAAFAAAVPTELGSSVEELCVSGTSRHEVHINDESYHVHCTLDALLLPFLVETGSFEIRSKSPVSDSVINIDGSLESIAVDPADAVMSFGVARTRDRPQSNGLDPCCAYQQFCPYVNAFRSEAEYDHWTAETTDVISMPLSFDTAFALAQALSNQPSHHAP